VSDWAAIQERYLRDGIETRLGGLAANLSRIGTLSRRTGYSDVVGRLVRESSLFIEWTARDVPTWRLVELAELQRMLARWHRAWPEVWSDDSQRAQIAADAAAWSGRVLEMSGLSGRGA